MGWGVHDYPEPPEPKPEEFPHCPVCGEWCDTIYRNREGEIIGCDNCVDSMDAWDCDSCFPRKE